MRQISNRAPIILPTQLILFLVYFIIINIPILSGLVGYGDDTGAFDFPYRILSSQLSEYKDTLFWYPYAGDGVPQLSLEYVGLTWSPLGVLLGYLIPYDYQTLGIEIIIWRATGALGSYALARHWSISPIGSTAVAATYIASGTMSRAALSFITLIGQMLAPWILYTSLKIIEARSFRETVFRIVHFSVVYGILLWCGYAATALILPVLLAPIVLYYGYKRKTQYIRIVISFLVSLLLILAFIAPLIYETMNGPIDHLNPTYRSAEASMLVGNTRSIDFIGLLLPNPSYNLPHGPDDLQPIYTGIIPIIVFIAQTRFSQIPRHQTYSILFLSLALFFLFSLPNLPVYFSQLNAQDYFSPISVFLYLFFPVILIIGLNIYAEPLTPRDKLIILVIFFISCLSTDNPIANYLRNTTPPFSLVRHNFLWFWLFSLLISIFAWSKLDRLFHDETSLFPPTYATATTFSLTRAFHSNIVPVSLSVLLISYLYIASHNTSESFAKEFPVGKIHLLWQVLSVGLQAILFTAVLIVHFRATDTYRNFLLFLILLIPCSIYVLCSVSLGPHLRALPTGSLTLSLTNVQRFTIDFFHIFFIICLFVVAIVTPTLRRLRPHLILGLCLLDMGVASHRYYSDSDRFSTPQQGWPWNYTSTQSRAVTNNFQPRNAIGKFKADFWQPFTGTIRPYPAVELLRHEWDTDYQTWVHFPEAWYASPNGVDITVLRTDLLQPPDFNPPSWTPTWGVNAAATGGRNTKPNYPNLTIYEADLLVGDMSINYPCNGPYAPGQTFSDFKLNYMLSTTVSLTTNTTCARLLIFTDSWSPSWHATVNGKQTKVYRANKAIRAIMIPSGTNAIIWTYDTTILFKLALLPISLIISLFILYYYNKYTTSTTI